MVIACQTLEMKGLMDSINHTEVLIQKAQADCRIAFDELTEENQDKFLKNQRAVRMFHVGVRCWDDSNSLPIQELSVLLLLA